MEWGIWCDTTDRWAQRGFETEAEAEVFRRNFWTDPWDAWLYSDKSVEQVCFEHDGAHPASSHDDEQTPP